MRAMNDLFARHSQCLMGLECRYPAPTMLPRCSGISLGRYAKPVTFWQKDRELALAEGDPAGKCGFRRC